MAKRHTIGIEKFHYKWDKRHEPVLTIDPGDTVTFRINDVASWQLTERSTSADVAKLDVAKLYPLAGPVYVRGAKPGDSLRVEVLGVEVADFGWSAISPGVGLLEEFRKPYLYKWDVSDKGFAPFEKGIKVPVRPFCGVMGVAPKESGSFDVMPPGRHGGNMDIRHLVAGSALELPVHVEGALFSTGDVHAAMGDGEVCLCAIECAGTARFRFGLVKRANITWPRYTTPREQPPKLGHYAATGISDDLLEATKESVRNLIAYLTGTYGLTPEQAYVLCSVAADVRVHEVVDRPNWVVGTMVPRDIFPK